MLLTRAPVATICIATHCAAPRLACVRPVASVHPEPGSNSHIKSFIVQNSLSLFFLFRSVFRLLLLFGCGYLKPLQSFDCVLFELFSRIFQGYFTVQLSMFCCSCLFDSLIIISKSGLSVKNFFIYFSQFLSFRFSGTLCILPFFFVFVNILC